MIKLLRRYYNKVIQSIAFYPAIIAIGFLLFSWVMLKIDFSPWGKDIKASLNWLSLKDANTARTITATIAAGIISLTVFSFSMVMIVLNQAASQMSNRVLTSMIGNRFQQVVLGCYIGTTVYALFLLSTIRNISDGIAVPALSIYLLILLTVVNIFLFIYFLDYVTQMVKYETVIDRVKKQTVDTMRRDYTELKEENTTWNELPYTEVRADESGYFQSFNEALLLEIACKHDLYISFLYKQGTYLIKNVSFIKVHSKKLTEAQRIKEILASIDFFNGHPINKNADYGLKQLSEIAIKALSPGINDPGTAVISLQALSDALAFRLYHKLPSVRYDIHKTPRIFVPSSSFHELFEDCIRPIWDYGKHDRYIQQEMLNMIKQLNEADFQNYYTEIFNEWLNTIQRQSKAS
ncbi:MAG: hypothetical protein BGO69_03350 [Bacteroidetes bacterium 46-16]|nr:MAG: hypothetical protein BGO69_03350 [Bacteroidetes bacterium 46-16]